MNTNQTINQSTVPAIVEPALRPDLVANPIQAPAWVDEVAAEQASYTSREDFVNAIGRLHAAESASDSSFVVAKVATWHRVGSLLAGMYVAETTKEGELPSQPSWAELRKYLAGTFGGRKHDPRAVRIGGYAIDSLQRAYNAYRYRAVETLGRWLELCADANVVKSDPQAFRPDSAVSALRWAAAAADVPTRVDKSGRVIAGGSNRSGTGRGETPALVNPRLTVAAAAAKRAEEAAADRTRVSEALESAKALLVTKPRAQILGETEFLTGSDLTALSLDDLRTLARFVAAAIDLKSAAPIVPADQVAADAVAAATSEPEPEPETTPKPRKRAAGVKRASKAAAK